MIYDYITTKPPLDENTMHEYGLTYLEHGRMKGWAAAAHKYLDRVWKNGKWVYKYAKNAGTGALRTAKSKALDLKTRFNRRIRGMSPDQISMKNGTFTFARKDNGKALSTTRPYGNRVYNGERELYNNGYSKKSIEKNYKGGSPMGSSDMNAYYTRKEKAKKNVRQEEEKGRARTSQLKSKGYKQGNLSKKGYSNSTSGDNSSAIKKSKIIANQKQKVLDKRGYYNSKVDTPYKKKTGVTNRGYSNSTGRMAPYVRSHDDIERLYNNYDYNYNYYNKSQYRGYKGPMILSPSEQESAARYYQNKAGRAGWLTAAQKRAGYVNKKRTKK